MSGNNPAVFAYTDYVAYLHDWHQEKKNVSTSYSYQTFAHKAGISNKGYVYNIFKGKKPLSARNCARFSDALGHSKSEAEYFEALVNFCHSHLVRDKNVHFEKMCVLKNRGSSYSEIQTLRQDQFEYFSHWYYAAVRSIIGMYHFRDDYVWLARMTHPRITVTQAKQSIRLLEKLGIIVSDSSGFYRLSNKSISSGTDVTGLAISNFHCECTSLARDAICSLPKSERNISGLTLGISRQAYESICQKLADVQKEIMHIANNDKKADRVYQLNFEFFPFSQQDSSQIR